MRRLLLVLLQGVAINALAQLHPVASGVYHLQDLTVKKEEGRETRQIMEGTTNEFEYFEIHATTQQKGAKPKPAHSVKDAEELIIVKEGSMKLIAGSKTGELNAGSIALIPPQVSQSIENIGDGPLTYYVLKFRSKKPMNLARSDSAGGTLMINDDTLKVATVAKGATIKYFDRATAMCDNYEMHITKLTYKGPSHAPHQHLATEIILITEGEVEMTIDGKTSTGTAGDLFIVESGLMHGVGNAAEKPCVYFAFKWR